MLHHFQGTVNSVSPTDRSDEGEETPLRPSHGSSVSPTDRSDEGEETPLAGESIIECSLEQKHATGMLMILNPFLTFEWSL